ncbi:MAG: hypothetical protein ACRDRH_05825 [Pseudonocardia sp.]
MPTSRPQHGKSTRRRADRPAARSVLNDRQAHDLTETVNACALGSRAIPAPLRADLSAALDTSEAVLTRTPQSPPGQHPTGTMNTAPADDPDHEVLSGALGMSLTPWTKSGEYGTAPGWSRK